MNPYLSKFCFKYQYDSKPKHNLYIYDIHMIFYTRFTYPSLSVPESSTVATYGTLATALLKSSMAPPKIHYLGLCTTLIYLTLNFFVIWTSNNAHIFYLQGIECCQRTLHHILYHIMIWSHLRPHFPIVAAPHYRPEDRYDIPMMWAKIDLYKTNLIYMDWKPKISFIYHYISYHNK